MHHLVKAEIHRSIAITEIREWDEYAKISSQRSSTEGKTAQKDLMEEVRFTMESEECIGLK